MTQEEVRQIQSAISMQKAGRLSDAASLFQQVLQGNPENFDCVYMLAMLYAQQGQFPAAADMFRRAAKIRPNVSDIQFNLAVALGMAGQHAEAADIYRKILKVAPQNLNARNNYAASLLSAGQTAAALREYDALMTEQPASADVHNNRGMALHYLKRLDEALASYDKAVAIQPAFAEAHANRGNVLAALQRPDDALSAYETAIRLRPDFAEAHTNIGNVHINRRAHVAALSAYDRALALHPGDPDARSMRFYAKMHLCDWSNFDAEWAALKSSVDAGAPLYPFSIMAAASSADMQLRCAKAFAGARYPLADRPLWRGEIYRHDKIRLGYVSADFRAHALAYLTAGLFENHDRTRFDITALSIGADDGSEMRKRLQGAFDRFIDARGLSDADTARRIRELEIDILIDLGGFTEGSRMGVFAQRPAPIQVEYLGYPATTGAACIGYVIADHFVIPDAQRSHYSEKVVRLPDTFQANDSARHFGGRLPSREEMRLPDGAFVFCSFNNSYKITPAVFDVWMRLLRKTNGSVLWLVASNPLTATNLQKEAQNRGVDPGRIIFAPRIEYADYLSRYRLADLFLDTFPFNAGTTASDALWAGLPLVTCAGETFTARMAGSLLTTLGMSELIADTLPAYERIAEQLAGDAALMAATREKLGRNRSTHPVFDTKRFTRHIEAAYSAMHDRLRAGLKPDDIDVTR